MSGYRMRLKKGEVIELPVRRIGINGEGVGYFRKQVVFVEGAVPGETVTARVTEVDKRHARARIIRVNKKSAYRTKPECPVYRECGACQLMHIDRRMQKRLKRELVQEAFARYTPFDEVSVDPVVVMDEPRGYRNKAQLPVRKVGGRVVTGLYAAGSRRLVETSGCLVQHPVLDRVLSGVAGILGELNIPVYDERTHRGSVRHLAARVSFAFGDVQLMIVSRTETLPKEDELVRLVHRRLPEVKSIVLNHNPDRTPLVLGEKSRVLFGPKKLRERLGDLEFRLSARSFFQLNPVQTVRLYEEVRKAARLTGTETVVDAYCGAGTIGLWLARDAARVIGMDTVPDAIEDARENADINGIRHAEFHVGRAEELLPEWLKDGLRPDVVVTDPPRTGLGEALIRALIEVKPPRLVYVSCNPSTLAKDVAKLAAGGYVPEKVVPVDMFPETAHVEAVCVLTVSGGGPGGERAGQ
ncbi:23S rRNA (uracil(1939)-C(5))-methyltransferase RlmD [Staphylospora marina]|uniref:23S rRNA (uracil(1939)-C(5))-methyltransferase RlmD n=1 Tax=Staphylospora marina TaxID=2490858 RepID=UPI000F5B91AB|nr:23S rRNA (uracil(1939)-C(5))-methyltransferase RlmD [Staphylospora marina]